MVALKPDSFDPVRLLSDWLRLSGVAHIGPEPAGEPELLGKRLGLINGAAWVIPWSYYFGRLYLPGVHLINVGNEAVQINFMEAHAQGEPCPPRSNIDTFVRYARDLAELAQVDAILITCSTMNRSYTRVAEVMVPYGVPVVQIDRPMMERAVSQDGRVLVVATHGPTVSSTQALLSETANELGRQVVFSGKTVEKAWDWLAAGDVLTHNQLLADAISSHLDHEEIGCVILAQLSMAAFQFSYPDPIASFGVPVLTSAQCGFERVRELLTEDKPAVVG